MRIRPSMKAAAEKAAVDDHRSLTSLIEKLLSDFLIKRRYLRDPSGSPRGKVSRRKAAELASREIDRLGDLPANAEDRATRKRRLIRGPREFCGVRGDQPKDK